LVILVLSGCISVPSVDSYGLPYYASVPLREAGIRDERLAFADIFCGVLASTSNPELTSAPCTDFLHLEGESSGKRVATGIDPARPLKLIFVPGFLGDCLARYATPFEDGRVLLKQEGLDSELILVNGRASSAYNARTIAQRMSEPDISSGPPVVLIGYSKGIADILEALHLLEDELTNVAAVVSVAGAVNGTPLADDQNAFMRGIIDRIPLAGCPGSEDDGDAIDSLSYEHRQAWLAQHPPPQGPHYFSIAAFDTIENMSAVNRTTYRMLSKLDARNDGQILYRDALLPNGTLLAFAKVDHMAIALPIDEEDGFLFRQAVNRNTFPRAELLKALVIYLQRADAGGNSASPNLSPNLSVH
jgi:hypothetical protein